MERYRRNSRPWRGSSRPNSEITVTSSDFPGGATRGTIMQLQPSEISDLIKSKIQNLDTHAEVRTQGTVVSVTDGICRVHGLSDAMAGEMLEFPGNTFGLALNLERDSVGAVILGQYEHITEGDTVKCTGKILSVPVGPGVIDLLPKIPGIPVVPRPPDPGALVNRVDGTPVP